MLSSPVAANIHSLHHHWSIHRRYIRMYVVLILFPATLVTKLTTLSLPLHLPFSPHVSLSCLPPFYFCPFVFHTYLFFLLSLLLDTPSPRPSSWTRLLLVPPPGHAFSSSLLLNTPSPCPSPSSAPSLQWGFRCAKGTHSMFFKNVRHHSGGEWVRVDSLGYMYLNEWGLSLKNGRTEAFGVFWAINE